MKLGWLTYSILLTLIVSGAPSAAIENRFVRCASYLISQSEYHKTPSISRQYTLAALSDLHRFRSLNLKDTDQVVAQRIAGIMHDRAGSNIDIDEDGATKQVLIATEFEGRENILNELDRRSELANQLHANNQFVLRGLNGISWTLHPAVGAASSLLLAESPNIAMHTAWYAGAIAAFFGWANRTYLERTMRGFGLYNYGPRVEENFKSALDKLENGKWLYSSSDEQLPLDSVREVYKMAELHEKHIHDFYNWQIYPYTTVRFTGTGLMNDPEIFAGHRPSASGWVRTDEVLLWDPIANQPKMIVILRITEKLPAYPKPSPIRSNSSRIADPRHVLDGI